MYSFVSYNNGVLVTTTNNKVEDIQYTYDFNTMMWNKSNLLAVTDGNKIYIVADKLQYASTSQFDGDEYIIIEKYYNQYLDEILTPIEKLFRKLGYE